MIRRIAVILACTLWPAIVQAQDRDQPVSVYFEPLKGEEFTRLNKAIAEALSRPPLRLATKPDARTLNVTVPDKVEVDHKRISGTYYSFMVSFSRNGDSLGRSQQNCGENTLSDCTDQLVLDVESAAAPR